MGMGTPLTGFAPATVTPLVVNELVMKLVPNGSGAVKTKFTASAVPELVTVTV